jgi:hypothetical protein
MDDLKVCSWPIANIWNEVEWLVERCECAAPQIRRLTAKTPQFGSFVACYRIPYKDWGVTTAPHMWKSHHVGSTCGLIPSIKAPPTVELHPVRSRLAYRFCSRCFRRFEPRAAAARETGARCRW